MFEEMNLAPEELRKRFESINESVRAGHYYEGRTMANPILRRKLGLISLARLGCLYWQYQNLSERERREFGFDVEGLIKKVRGYIKH